MVPLTSAVGLPSAGTTVHVGAVVALGDELHRAGGGGEEGVVRPRPTLSPGQNLVPR